MSRGKRPNLWSISSYILLSIFLTVFLFLGLLNQSTYMRLKKPKYDFPDFDRISSFSRELSENEVDLGNSNSRVLVIGDVHGMNESLHDLLDHVSYNPEHDTLFFAGDLLAKSSHATSLSVIDFLTKNHNVQGKDRIFAVRGNHDHVVVQWRAWREWFESLTLPAPAVQSHAPFFFRIPSVAVQRFASAAYSLFAAGAGIANPDAVVVSKKTDQASPVSTGREFLELIEAEWAIEKVENEPDPEEYAEVVRKRSVGTWREAWWQRIPPQGKGRSSQSWNLFTDHYWLARDMSPAQAEYLKSLPLVLHAPHLHLFVAHAGLLPSDPRLSPTDPRQPLAHLPHVRSGHHAIGYDPERDVETDSAQEDAFVSRLRANMAALQEQETAHVLASSFHDVDYGKLKALQPNLTEADMRAMQEAAVLQEVPQNRDPWVVLNMRSVKKKGKVTKNGDKGTPWSELWNEQMDRCDGFPDYLSSEDSSEDTVDDVDSSQAIDADNHGKRKYSLQCHPATVVYGHAASRGLDIKRWSMGLDTGCLYGRKLTALVLTGPDHAHDDGDDDDDEDDDDDDDDDGNEHGDKEDDEDDNDDFADEERASSKRKVHFGDRKAGIKARIAKVQCPVIDGQH